MQESSKTGVVLTGVAALFAALGVMFVLGAGGHPAPRPEVPLVSLEFINTNTARMSFRDLKASGGDTSGTECYTCHEKNKPPKIKYDEHEKLVLPKEHDDLKMAHGRHDRNNNCFNCHNEKNLESLQTRDGRQLKIEESPQLCGSCHGPTYRDWEWGVHGRTTGYWNRTLGPYDRKVCTSCHDPHAPKFPSRKPAPGPHDLRLGKKETH